MHDLKTFAGAQEIDAPFQKIIICRNVPPSHFRGRDFHRLDVRKQDFRGRDFGRRDFRKSERKMKKRRKMKFGTDLQQNLRKKSDTFGLWAGIKLDALNANHLWIPSGFAHGFLSLERNTVFQYKVTNPYSKKHERSLIWNDSKIKVKWPEINGQFIISKKDLEAPSFEPLEYSNALF